MPLGTLDRTPPPFFRQGASALSKLMFFSALALFLMVADTRFNVTGPIRVAVASVIYPLQWALLQPVQWSRIGYQNVQSLSSAREDAVLLREQLRLQAPRAHQYEQLALENDRLRELLELRPRLPTPTLAAQVLYDAADPYEHKVVIDKGLLHGISPGSPVVDASGVLGQVTQVYPSLAEVTLLIDAEQAIPVLNTRTGMRAVAFGEPGRHGGVLELRYIGANADVQPGDLLTTSGIDGVFPPGLPVARVDKVERRVESPFALIHCVPQARVDGATHVLVLPSMAGQLPDRPHARPEPPAAAANKGSKGATR
ncbi:MAG: rod shape-determining protein MreC [Curvibacter sp.]|jgi:rod shape-determining protein MreC|nr:rod shape-determining protein MreC [Curvibacter sp.]